MVRCTRGRFVTRRSCAPVVAVSGHVETVCDVVPMQVIRRVADLARGAAVVLCLREGMRVGDQKRKEGEQALVIKKWRYAPRSVSVVSGDLWPMMKERRFITEERFGNLVLLSLE